MKSACVNYMKEKQTNLFSRNRRPSKEAKKVTEEYRVLYARYEKVKQIRLKSEHMLNRLKQTLEAKSCECETLTSTVAGRDAALDECKEMQKKYSEQKSMIEEKDKKLKMLSHQVEQYMKVFILENQMCHATRTVLEDIQNKPLTLDHRVVDELMLQMKYKQEKDKAAKEQMCEEYDSVKEKIDELSRCNKEIKIKMKMNVKTKNNLVQQNETLLGLMQKMQDGFFAKDKLIKDLASRDKLKHPALRRKIMKITKGHRKTENIWRRKLRAANRKLQNINKNSKAFENKMEQDISILMSEHIARTKYNSLKEKYDKEILEKEMELAHLAEQYKTLKEGFQKVKEVVDRDLETIEDLKRKKHEKDIEIIVLTEAERRYKRTLESMQSKLEPNEKETEKDCDTSQ